LTRLASWQDYGTHDESAYPELWRGCVGAWAPCLGPTGTRLHDLSRYRNWGTLTNMDTATDWVVSGGMYALDFDGVNDHATLPFSSGVSRSFTFSCWVNLRRIGSSQPEPFFNVQVASYSNYWASFGTYNGRLSLGLFDGTNNPLTGDLGVGFAPNTSQWYHFAGVRDVIADTIADYVNGSLNRTVTDTTTSIPNYGTLTLGGQTTPSNRFANALIDDWRVYDRALSPAEIRLLATRRGIAFERRKRQSLHIPQTSSLRRKILTGQV
jgi:hypothetical protein